MAGLEISLRVDSAAVQAAMRKASPSEIHRRGSAAMGETLGYLQAEVQRGTPVDTGVLRGSIFTEQSGWERGRVASPIEYALPIEMGARPHTIRPRRARLLSWIGQGGRVFARVVHHPGNRPYRMFHQAAEGASRAVESIWLRHFRIW